MQPCLHIAAHSRSAALFPKVPYLQYRPTRHPGLILPIKQWLVASLLRICARLPYSLLARFGETVGTLLYLIPGKRRHIVRTNIELCFPEKTDAERDVMARATFRHVIRSYVERSYQWYGSADKLAKLVTIDSAIELSDSYAQPTIFLAFHFAGIEAGCVSYSTRHPVASVYTPMSSVSADEIALAGRARFGVEMIPRKGSARKILQTLKTGKPVMLAADMDFGLRDSEFVPFFGVPACTLTAVSRLAAASGARVVPFVTEVLPNYKGYRLRLFEPLDAYPSQDSAVDARRTNEFLETQIRRLPDQYYWVHRRFKRRPSGEAPVY